MTNPIRFPIHGLLDLSHIMPQEDNQTHSNEENCKFECCSFVIHAGSGYTNKVSTEKDETEPSFQYISIALFSIRLLRSHSGHYFALVKHAGKWFKANDSTFSEVTSPNELMRYAESAYIIFYSSVDNEIES